MKQTRVLTSMAAAAFVAAVTLAGCAPVPSGDDPAEPTVLPTVTVTAPPPEAEPQPDYGFTFFHGATIGSTWEELSDQLNYPVSGLEECPYFGPLWQTATMYTSAFFDPDGLDDGALFFYMNEAYPPSTHYPRNAEGVGIGSTVAEVLAAYPSAVQSGYTDIGAGDLKLITVEDPDSDSKYVFAHYAGSPTIQMLQWGPSAGHQWSHLCGGL